MKLHRVLQVGSQARKAADNFGWLVVERAGRLVCGALVGVLVARHLGPERLGVLSYGVAMITLLAFFPALGLDEVLKRDLLRTPERTGEFLASGLWLRLAAGAVAYAGVLGWVCLGRGGEDARLASILGLTLFQPALYVPELWLQANLQGKRTTLVQLGVLALSSIVRLRLIATDASLAAFAWVVVAEAVFCAAGYWVWAKRAGLVVVFRSARMDTMRRLLAESWPLMFAHLAVIVYLRIDEVMLRHLEDARSVGVYAAAVKLSELWYFLPVALASSVLPALLRAKERGAEAYAERQQRYYDLCAAAAYALSAPIAILAPWIVGLVYGGRFEDAAPVLAVHIWASVFVFLGVARGQWLVNEGLQKFYLAATTLGAVANVALNWLMIPRWGALGAAYATVISYALAGWLASFFHPVARRTGLAQTRALLIPFRAWKYFRRS